MVDVQRVWQMRESLEVLELQDSSAASLKSMLLTASISLSFVTCNKVSAGLVSLVMCQTVVGRLGESIPKLPVYTQL